MQVTKRTKKSEADTGRGETEGRTLPVTEGLTSQIVETSCVRTRKSGIRRPTSVGPYQTPDVSTGT